MQKKIDAVVHESELSRFNRILVFGLAAWSGFFVMSVELLSSRLLAPVFGGSIAIWGAVITVFMLALSIGYLFGGRFSLKQPSVTKYIGIVIASTVSLLPLIFFGDTCFRWIASMIPDVRYGALVACLSLFFIPTVLSGMVSPYAIRLLIRDVATSGQSSGFLYFVSTFGSALGTLFTSFYLVLWFEIHSILLALILVTLLFSVIGLCFQKRTFYLRLMVVCLLMVIPALYLKHLYWIKKFDGVRHIVHVEKSAYRDILVYDLNDQKTRCAGFNRARLSMQGCIYLNNPQHLVFKYFKDAMAGLYFQPEPKKILILGLGVGVLPRTLHQILPDAEINVVEIDPAVTKIAQQFFHLIPDARLTIHHQDARLFVQQKAREQQHYDMIFLDAFDGDYIPEHLLTREFLREVKQVLASNGVVIANTFSMSKLYDYETATYAAEFKKLYQIKDDNRVLFVKDGPSMSKSQLSTAAGRWRDIFAKYGVNADEVAAKIETEIEIKQPNKILTDQYSPSNLLNQ